ncbi:glutamyl-tRNA(Gln) amidotransferase subunit F, mitochondrial [Diutina catenulata]
MLKRLPRIRVGCRRSVHFKSEGEITEFLAKPKWSVTEAITAGKSAIPPISDTTITKLITLSGLPPYAPNTLPFKEIKEALTSQMAFIAQLYQGPHDAAECHGSNDGVFRLIASDFNKENQLTLASLKKCIDEVKPSSMKGELGFDISSLVQNKAHFTVKTME